MKKRPYELYLSGLIFIFLCIGAFLANTTGDTGDSIMHYLYSRYAFRHPNFFFDHWAKPVFVLLSAPFAQGGMVGIELFNCACAVLTALCTFYICRHLNIRYPLLVFVFLFFSPLYFNLVFSGLTEYLFGLILVFGIYLEIKKRSAWSLLIISFLPLARSEGLIVMGVFALYHLYKKNWRQLPILISGQLLYTLIGGIFYRNILWVFREIPYARLASPYGEGRIFDFVHRLNYVIEKPIFVLLLAGLLFIFYTAFRSGLKEHMTILIFLVAGSFIVYFVAHSIFWWKGIFNSMGLPRVLISIVPLVAIIALYGLEELVNLVSRAKLRTYMYVTVVLAIIIFPFSPKAQGVVYKKGMFHLIDNDFIEDELAPYIRTQINRSATHCLFYSHPGINLALGDDPFDKNTRRDIQKLYDGTMPPAGSTIVWDNWYSVTEGGVSLDQLSDDKRFFILKELERREGDKVVHFAVYATIY